MRVHVLQRGEFRLCVRQCLSVNYISVSTKLDTKGWMTQ